jgi:hypothetical protein
MVLLLRVFSHDCSLLERALALRMLGRVEGQLESAGVYPLGAAGNALSDSNRVTAKSIPTSNDGSMGFPAPLSAFTWYCWASKLIAPQIYHLRIIMRWRQ